MMSMSDDPTLPPMGNARVDAAASRLNQAFVQLTQKMEHLQTQLTDHPEVELLEQENMRLHEENASLKELLQETDQQLETMARQVAEMMGEAA